MRKYLLLLAAFVYNCVAIGLFLTVDPLPGKEPEPHIVLYSMIGVCYFAVVLFVIHFVGMYKQEKKWNECAKHWTVQGHEDYTL